MKKIIIFFVFIFNLNFSFAQDTIKISKPYLPEDNYSLVFAPHNNQINKSYPLLFLLHGYDGNYLDWNKHIGIQNLADKYNFIIVCPNGYFNSWYVDSPIKKNSQYEKFFWEDLVPQIMKQYQVDKTSIFITGLSMGGHGALNIYLKNQEYFKAAGSMSGVLDIRLFPDNWGIKDLLGEYKFNKKVWDNNSAVANLKKYYNKKTNIIIDCGTEDFALPSNEKFYNEAKKLKVKIQYNTRKGDHNWDFWCQTVGRHLNYFSGLVK
ncbi:MAG: alpha/beta hydrolase family protein [bacterium]